MTQGDLVTDGSGMRHWCLPWSTGCLLDRAQRSTCREGTLMFSLIHVKFEGPVICIDLYIQVGELVDTWT